VEAVLSIEPTAQRTCGIAYIYNSFVYLLLCFINGSVVRYLQLLFYGQEQPLLSEEASAAVNKLLPDYAKGDLASLCSWADQVRFRYRWASPLHFIDTPDNKCKYIYSRDCHNAEGKEGMCVDGA